MGIPPLSIRALQTTLLNQRARYLVRMGKVTVSMVRSVILPGLELSVVVSVKENLVIGYHHPLLIATKKKSTKLKLNQRSRNALDQIINKAEQAGTALEVLEALA